MRLIDNWRAEARRLWCIRVAVFWGAFNGALLGLAVFSEIIPAPLFLALNVLGYAMIAGARMLKQPGADQ